MLAQKNRLPREGYRGRGYSTVATPFFSLKAKNNSLETSRIGVVVGLSVDKRATRRNFWERQVKTQLLGLANLNKDFVVIIFPRVNSLTRKQFIEEFQKALKKIK